MDIKKCSSCGQDHQDVNILNGWEHDSYFICPQTGCLVYLKEVVTSCIKPQKEVNHEDILENLKDIRAYFKNQKELSKQTFEDLETYAREEALLMLAITNYLES